MHYTIDSLIHTTAFGIPVMEHWLDSKKITDLLKRFNPMTQVPQASPLQTELIPISRRRMVLFNDALNKFCIRHIVKDHIDSHIKKRNSVTLWATLFS